MERAQGQSLENAIIVSRDHAMSIFKKLVEGIAYLHEQGVCHRDLHPSNVIIGESGSLKIIDFNAAIKLGKEETKIRGGTGFKWWSAPETRTELTYGLECDSWSLGLIFAFLISGRKPAESKSFQELREEALNCSED